MKRIAATIRGGWNTSIQILLDTVHQVGDILDLSNINKLVPEGMNFTAFFNAYVNFCTENGDSRRYVVEAVSETASGYEMSVRPA